MPTPGKCEHCGAHKGNVLGLCDKCGRFPVMGSKPIKQQAKLYADLRQRDEELNWLRRNDPALGKSVINRNATDHIPKPFRREAVKARFLRARGMKRLEAEPAEYHQNLDNMGSIPFSANSPW
jgi:hypothetical protein